MEKARPDEKQFLPAAGALAQFDPANAKWADFAERVAGELSAVEPSSVGTWSVVFEPVRRRLTPFLARIFGDDHVAPRQRGTVAALLTEFARDDPSSLARFLVLSGPDDFASFFRIAERQKDAIIPFLRATLAEGSTASWDDPPHDPSWKTADRAIVAALESAHGLLHERFAVCQTLPLAEFQKVNEALGNSGYRPVRLRPYADASVTRVAAVWTRDGREFRIAKDMAFDELVQEDRLNRAAGFSPVDVAGYRTTDAHAQPGARYAALWVKKETTDADGDLFVAKPDDELQGLLTRLALNDFAPTTLQGVAGTDGRMTYSGVLRRTNGGADAVRTEHNLVEADYVRHRDTQLDGTIVDVSIQPGSPQKPTRERLAATLTRSEARIKAQRSNLKAKTDSALAKLGLGDTEDALESLNVLMQTENADAEILPYRARSHSRLKRSTETAADLERFRQAYTSPNTRIALTTVVAAELEDRFSDRFDVLEKAIAASPGDPDLIYEAARADALASTAVARRTPDGGRRLVDRALQLLKKLVDSHEVDFARIENDAWLDPIRDDPRFAAIMKASHPERRYDIVWANRPRLKSKTVECVGAAEQVVPGRALISQGYRPAAWSVSRVEPDGALATVSLWHKPVPAEEGKDRLAARQARAAIALLRLGDPEPVWAFLRHGPDPRVRGFVVNWLISLGADPNLVVTRFQAVELRTSSDDASKIADTGAILRDQTTSTRRALLQLLGKIPYDKLPPSKREELANQVLALYRDDPDAGIHAAAEWTLRHWQPDHSLSAIDAELKRLGERNGRRWFLNGQGQTFALIENASEFVMGSPPSEPERNSAREARQRVSIPRGYAIQTKEVTVEQFQEFLETNPEFTVSRGDLNSSTVAPAGPWIAPTWYAAVAYCNWLSEQENLPPDQWCYFPNGAGVYAVGMKIPANVLERSGYRLPTEAEWEFAARAGTTTARYYGESADLLPEYACYSMNSDGRAHAVGSLLPNDLGLFDTLGNVFEWCQDRSGAMRPTLANVMLDRVLVDEVITSGELRILRGGGFGDLGPSVRSAVVYQDLPGFAGAFNGFRVAKSVIRRTGPSQSATPDRARLIHPQRLATTPARSGKSSR